MNEDKDTRQEAEEDAQEDLELKDEEADKVGGALVSELNIMKNVDKTTPLL
jgi:type VI protein secretion system component Hcp